MGLSCANIQAKSTLEELRAAVAKLGFDRVSLVRTPTSPWIAVVSDDFLPGDVEALSEFAKKLSKGTKTETLAITVSDSDYFWLDLFRAGKRSALLTNDEDEEPKLKAWAKATGVTLGELEAIWNRDEVFAEDYVRGFGALLQVDPTLSCTAFEYLGELDGTYEVVALESPRRAVAPSSDPVLRGAGLMLPLRPVQVEQMLGCSIQFESAGGEVRDLQAEVRFDRSLVSVNNAGVSEISAKFDRVWGLKSEIEQTGEGCLIRFPGFVIPGVETRKGKPIPLALSFTGNAGPQPASGEFRVTLKASGIEPLEAMAAFQIVASPPRPLKFHQGYRLAQALEVMATPSVLSGVVIFPDLTKLDRMQEAIERWLAGAINPPSQWTVSTIGVWDSSNPLKGPKKGSWKGTTADLATAKNREKLAAALSSFQTVSLVSPETARAGHYTVPDAGARFQIPLGGSSATPHLSFWTAAPVEGSRALLEALLDELMNHGGIQAFLARWAWMPEFDTVDGYRQTPYEEACGIPLGDAWMQLPWCSRWLRGVGEVTWIGEGLRQIAGVSDAKLVAVTLEDRKSVEQQLQSILPGAQDYGSVNSHSVAG